MQQNFGYKVILSGEQIREYIRQDRIIIEPFDGRLIGPSQIDLRLSSKFRVFKPTNLVDPFDRRSVEENTELVDTKGDPFVIQPGQLILGVTLEKVAIPNDLVASIEGRSSIARMGVFIHISSGHVNPGSGSRNPIPVTLEILNMNPAPVKLYPSMRVCQLLFYTMDKAVSRGYDDLGGKYAGKLEPSGSLAFREKSHPT